MWNLVIGTVDDRDLAKQLTLLRLGDADDMEETLRTYQRMEGRQYPSAMGSSKFRQRSASASTPIPSKPTRAVRAIRLEGSSSESDSDLSGSDADTDRRNLCVATVPDRVKKFNDQRAALDHLNQDRGPDRVVNQKACTHCGSKKHDDRGCWKRLTCQKCGRKGHPSDKCFFTCAACGDVHESGKCRMEEFYNMIRKWYVPTKHAGMLPPKAEEMLS
ncbi:unnamed protein product [Peronospora farinosa]|uniref:CCHC-type domain-containing protein n=1 Tax=Peronospora farinosa TaxID=134698 RepID=A0ABN8BUN3_9STRA|nr:unnamed protein product [Peronospora farinosa]